MNTISACCSMFTIRWSNVPHCTKHVIRLRHALHWLLWIDYMIVTMTFKNSLCTPASLSQWTDQKLFMVVVTAFIWKGFSLIELTTKTFTTFRAFQVTMPHFWNNMPLDIRSSTSIRGSCSDLKTFLCPILFIFNTKLTKIRF